MTQYDVSGMSCAACSARVEKAVNSVQGVSSCAVSLLTNSMGVEGDAAPDDIIRAVENAGYGAKLKNDNSKADKEDALKDNETPKIRNRLIASVLFLIPLMYISMGHMMWNFPLPSFLADNHISMAIAQMILSAIVLVINQKFFISGFKGVIHRAPNMDTLVALGSGTSFIYSVVSLFLMSSAQLRGDSAAVMGYMHNLYFESAAMILTLITVGKLLEAYSKGKTTNALKGLMNLAPKSATVIRNGEERIISVDDIALGDIFVVKTGESIPIDGVVIEGECSVDESALTGESIPVDKNENSSVYAGTINQNGYIKCKATKIGENTTLSQIIKMVEEASATKAPIAKTADKVSSVFVPVVILIAIITLIIWLIAGQELSYSLSRAVSVLVISCPCALGLATPVAVMVGSGIGAKNGILFKNAASLEEAGRIQIVCLDKTGTVTKGEPEVNELIASEDISEENLLKLAYSLEIKSAHPLAKAVNDYAVQKEIQAYESEEFKTYAGNGIGAVINGRECFAGSYKFISSKAEISEKMKKNIDEFTSKGKTPLLFTIEDKLIGIIAVADAVKEDSKKAIDELKNMGIKVVMLTGDNKKTAKAIAEEVGADKVFSEVLPNDKEGVIRKLQSFGKVAMVGDGINDAPALTRADIGIAIGAGSDIAIDSADIVLMNSSLCDVSAAIRLSRKTLKNIYENLFWAFIYNIIGIPLAAGAFIALTGWAMKPMFGAAAMSLSSFCVVTNALRLNLFKPSNAKKDKKIKSVEFDIEEENSVKKTVKIEGMMCMHCEAAVKKALEAFDEVDEAAVSHENGEAVLSLNAALDNEKIKDAVEKLEYKFIGIEE
ncbi:MAG: heavy metal translocating P-type ATPase [Eubacterium sp.]|nr:heavy metal translocating P-type ATPase [Eubacterium sp.]